MDGSRSLLELEKFLEPDDSPGLTFRCQPAGWQEHGGVDFINPTSCAKLFYDTLEAGQTFREPGVHAVSWYLRRSAPTGRVDTVTFGPQAVGASWNLAVALDSALTTHIAGPHLHVWW